MCKRCSRRGHKGGSQSSAGCDAVDCVAAVAFAQLPSGSLLAATLVAFSFCHCHSTMDRCCKVEQQTRKQGTQQRTPCTLSASAAAMEAKRALPPAAPPLLLRLCSIAFPAASCRRRPGCTQAAEQAQRLPRCSLAVQCVKGGSEDKHRWVQPGGVAPVCIARPLQAPAACMCEKGPSEADWGPPRKQHSLTKRSTDTVDQWSHPGTASTLTNVVLITQRLEDPERAWGQPGSARPAHHQLAGPRGLEPQRIGDGGKGEVPALGMGRGRRMG